MDLTDNFELRYREPKIHAMSFDADVSYLGAIPHKNHPDHILDEGVLIVSRESDPETFRKLFLQLFEENRFVKTTVEEFLSLKRTIIFDIDGTQLGPNWYVVHRGRFTESDTSKISMLIPEKWELEARAVKSFDARMSRIAERTQKLSLP